MRSKVLVAALALSLLALNAASAGTLYGVDDADHTLFSIDPDSLAVTTIGALGVETGAFGDLAYDPASGTMYWIGGRNNNSLYTINLTTGVATLVGSHGINDLFALGWVENGGGLYAQATNGNIYELSPTTAAATYFASNNVYPGGYDWDPDLNKMILLDAGIGDVYAIDGSGTATLLASSGFVNDSDIAYDGDRGVFWAADWSHNLYQFDSSWSRTTLLTTLGDVAALEYVPDAVPAPGALLLAGTGLLGLLRWRRKLAA
jgi:hypothetical protein